MNMLNNINKLNNIDLVLNNINEFFIDFIDCYCMDIDIDKYNYEIDYELIIDNLVSSFENILNNNLIYLNNIEKIFELFYIELNNYSIEEILKFELNNLDLENKKFFDLNEFINSLKLYVNLNFK